jgi:predicted DNA-binding transcriptional regulator YafY
MTRVDPIERVLNLLALLHESPRPLTRAEIVASLATGSTPYPTDEAAQHQLFTGDRRTISLGLGITIHQRVRGGEDAGRTEYWVDRRDLRLPALDLDEEERLALSLALGAVSRSVPHAGEAGLKLGADGRVPGEVPATPAFELHVDLPDQVIRVMEAARAERAVLRPGAAGSGSAQPFEPWVVVLDHGAWYAIGHDRTAGVPGVERIDRWRGDVVVLEDGDPGRTTTAPSLDQAAIRALVAELAPEPALAQVLVDELTAARASLTPLVVERHQTDLFGQVRLLVRVDDRDRFRSWLLGLGDRAELSGPPDLRDEVLAWLQRMVDTPPPPAVEVGDRPRPPGRRPGPEPVATRLHRLLSIVPWLYRQGAASVEEIAAAVGATTTQVLRDLTTASMCGAPPYSADVLFGFWVDPERGMVEVIEPTLLADGLRLTARQAAAVSLALASVGSVPGVTHAVVDRLRAKLDAALGPDPLVVTADEPPFLEAVRSAIANVTQLRLEYVDLDDRVTERTFDPQVLFADRGAWYVMGDDHLRGEERVFRVDRLLSAVLTEVRFTRRSVTPPAGATWQWMVPDREVVLRLPPGCEWVVDRYAVTGAADPAADGSRTVWLSVVSDRWLESLLLRCGPGVAVLAPSELAELPARAAASALARYG